MIIIQLKIRSFPIILLFSLVTLLLIPIHTNATSWEYSFVVWNGFIYEVTDEHVMTVDKEIGHVTKYSDMDSYSGNFSNAFQEGTKYYSIKGFSTDEVIAVEVEEAVYQMAINRGEFALGGIKASPVNLPISFIFLGAFIVLVVLVTILIAFASNKR